LSKTQSNNGFQNITADKLRAFTGSFQFRNLYRKTSLDYGCYLLHRVSKNAPPLACYNFVTREWILIFFGRNVIDKVGNQKTLYYATSNNLCFCTTWQNAETQKSHISLYCIVLHTQCTYALSS